jgi:hypothetical protein
MAIAKARSSLPVRGYYVTTINTGRVIQQSGSGFGLPRLGGLLNAQVEGLTGGSSATGRLAAQAPDANRFAASQLTQEEKERLKDHEEFKRGIREKVKIEAEDVKKGEALQKRLVEEAKKAEEKPKQTPHHVDIVKDPTTGTSRVTGTDKAAAADLDDPKQLAHAEKKSVEQQKQESAPTPPASTPPAGEKK